MIVIEIILAIILSILMILGFINLLNPYNDFEEKLFGLGLFLVPGAMSYFTFSDVADRINFEDTKEDYYSVVYYEECWPDKTIKKEFRLDGKIKKAYVEIDRTTYSKSNRPRETYGLNRVSVDPYYAGESNYVKVPIRITKVVNFKKK